MLLVGFASFSARPAHLGAGNWRLHFRQPWPGLGQPPLHLFPFHSLWGGSDSRSSSGFSRWGYHRNASLLPHKRSIGGGRLALFLATAEYQFALDGAKE